jgi:hypothetical protein
MKWFYYLIILGIISLILLIRTKVRGFFWKDKLNNKLSFKDFWKRFLSGVEGITPIQQTKTSLFGTIMIIAGELFGVVVTSFAHIWWIVICLIGGLIVTVVGVISLLQKYWRFKAVDNAMKEMSKQIDKDIEVSIEGKERNGMSVNSFEGEQYEK